VRAAAEKHSLSVAFYLQILFVQEFIGRALSFGFLAKPEGGEGVRALERIAGKERDTICDTEFTVYIIGKYKARV
jgi:hypothetical protein